jgi:hypothetical protein
MRKKAEVLGKTDSESVKKVRISSLICSQIQSPVVGVHVAECKADASEGVSAGMRTAGTARAHGLRVSVERSESQQRCDDG